MATWRCKGIAVLSTGCPSFACKACICQLQGTIALSFSIDYRRECRWGISADTYRFGNTASRIVKISRTLAKKHYNTPIGQSDSYLSISVSISVSLPICLCLSISRSLYTQKNNSFKHNWVGTADCRQIFPYCSFYLPSLPAFCTACVLYVLPYLSRRRCRCQGVDQLLFQGPAQGGRRARYLLIVGQPLPQGLGTRQANGVRYRF